MSADALTLAPVRSRRDWHDWLALPERLHAGDPHWVAPLRQQRRAQWSPRHPWFGHAEACLWLARRAGRPAGAISAQVDALHEQTWGSRVGYFGHFETEDDPVLVRRLLDEARAWLRARGCSALRGPFDHGINQSCGLLVDGFDRPPMIMMGHAPPWYDPRLREAGLQPAQDLLAYLLSPDFEAPRAMRRMLASSAKRISVRRAVLPIRADDLALVREIFNDAWSRNWGFVPFTEAEIAHMGREMRPLVKPGYLQFASVDGTPAAFILALPNINELITDLDGRLLPFGWARLLWRLQRRVATTGRVPLMGVRSEWQRGPLGAALALRLIEDLREPMVRDGIHDVELSWILENNRGMCSLIESLGGRVYKRYRLYEETL